MSTNRADEFRDMLDPFRARLSMLLAFYLAVAGVAVRPIGLAPWFGAFLCLGAAVIFSVHLERIAIDLEYRAWVWWGFNDCQTRGERRLRIGWMLALPALLTAALVGSLW
jgi:hypothetical protein